MSNSIPLSDFKKNLDTGKYKGLAGARRAVSKIHGWSAATKDAARKLVDAHFKVTDKPAKEPKRRGRPPKAASAKAPKATIKSAAKKGQKTKVASKPLKVKVKSAKPAKAATKAKADGGRLGLAELAHITSTISEAVKTIRECHDLTTLNIEEEVGDSVKILGRATKLLGSYVSPELDAAEGEAKTNSTNGAALVPVVAVQTPKRRGRKPKAAATPAAENGGSEHDSDAIPLDSLSGSDVQASQESVPEDSESEETMLDGAYH